MKNLIKSVLSRRDFDKFFGDAGLAGFIINDSKPFEKFIGIIGGGFHGNAPGGVLGSVGFENQVVDLHFNEMGY
jgi:hypothetical protein